LTSFLKVINRIANAGVHDGADASIQVVSQIGSGVSGAEGSYQVVDPVGLVGLVGLTWSILGTFRWVRRHTGCALLVTRQLG
jgi:hypothetical protein